MVKKIRLNRLVQFRRATKIDDGLQVVDVFEDHGNPHWVELTDLSDGERWRASEVQSNIAARMKIRYSAFTADLTPKDKVMIKGEEHEITGIKEIAFRMWLEISVAARSDT